MTGHEIRTRLVKLYQSVMGTDEEVGALMWAAGQLGVSRATVYSWVTERRQASPMTMRAIELLEFACETSRSRAKTETLRRRARALITGRKEP